MVAANSATPSRSRALDCRASWLVWCRRGRVGPEPGAQGERTPSREGARGLWRGKASQGGRESDPSPVRPARHRWHPEVFAGPIIGLENMKGVLSHRRGRLCVRVGGGVGRYGKREPESKPEAVSPHQCRSPPKSKNVRAPRPGRFAFRSRRPRRHDVTTSRHLKRTAVPTRATRGTPTSSTRAMTSTSQAPKALPHDVS